MKNKNEYCPNFILKLQTVSKIIREQRKDKHVKPEVIYVDFANKKIIKITKAA